MNDLGKAEDDVLELIGNALDRVSMSSRLCIYCIVYNPLHTNSTSYYMHTNLQNSDVGRWTDQSMTTFPRRRRIEPLRRRIKWEMETTRLQKLKLMS